MCLVGSMLQINHILDAVGKNTPEIITEVREVSPYGYRIIAACLQYNPQDRKKALETVLHFAQLDDEAERQRLEIEHNRHPLEEALEPVTWVERFLEHTDEP